MSSTNRTFALATSLRCALMTGCLLLAGASFAADAEWPQYRGVQANGVGEGSPPISWNVETGENLLWKLPIPGLGHSSPVIAGDRIYVTSAISGLEDPELKVGLYGDIKPVDDETEHRFMVYAIDAKSGNVVWERTAHTGVPKVKRHTKASHANSTAATDGKHVVAMFGSEGLYCYNKDGKLLWKKDFGVLDSGFFLVPQAQWGFASSPVIHDGKVFIQADVQKNSFIAAFDLKTGKELWKTERNDVPTWSTPTVVEHGGKTMVVVNGWKHTGGYDADSGKEIWKLNGGGDIPVPTPVIGEGHVYITNAHGAKSPVYAIRLDATGDISLKGDALTSDSITWSIAKGGAYMQTPVLYKGLLYVCRDNGVLSVFDAKTGERKYQQRLGGGTSGFTPSAVAADDKLYYTSEMGDVYVLKAGPEYELLAESTLDEVFMSTPAIAGDTIYFRAKDHLFAIGKKK